MVMVWMISGISLAICLPLSKLKWWCLTVLAKRFLKAPTSTLHGMDFIKANILLLEFIPMSPNLYGSTTTAMPDIKEQSPCCTKKIQTLSHREGFLFLLYNIFYGRNGSREKGLRYHTTEATRAGDYYRKFGGDNGRRNSFRRRKNISIIIKSPVITHRTFLHFCNALKLWGSDPSCFNAVMGRGSDPQRFKAIMDGKIHLKILFIPTRSRGY